MVLVYFSIYILFVFLINYNNKCNILFSDYKAKIIALGILGAQFKDNGADKEVMKKQLNELRNECERLMHNLKSSNRLLDEASKEKRHAENERNDLVKYLINYYYFLKCFILVIIC